MAVVKITCRHRELDRVTSVRIDEDDNPVGPARLISRCSCAQEIATERPFEDDLHDWRVERHCSLPATIVVYPVAFGSVEPPWL